MARLNRPIFLYGPPAAGKSTVGAHLAIALNCDFIDLDKAIEQHINQSIPEFFAQHGETEFRQLETQILQTLPVNRSAIIALGGGTLLANDNRDWVEAQGTILLLTADNTELIRRNQGNSSSRPLARDSQKLSDLLAERATHYASFPLQLDTTNLSQTDAVWSAQKALGRFQVKTPGETGLVEIQPEILSDIESLGELFFPGSNIVIISDSNIEPLYGIQLKTLLKQNGFLVHDFALPAGEQSKSISTLAFLWQSLAEARLDRKSTVIALGGGVITDLAGFASATYLRGIRWINLPTSLLAMVDAAIGGKTAIDLPQGKNLVGAFHFPALTWIDPRFLNSLPAIEITNGLAELAKSAILGDADLLQQCLAGRVALATNWQKTIASAAAVKIKVVNEDPFETGQRAILNFGHTIAHAIEQLSRYQIPHGQAVAIGMVAEARLGELAGITPSSVREIIEAAVTTLELPTRLPNQYPLGDWLAAMQSDKKNRDGQVGFALPLEIGKAQAGIFLRDLPALLTQLLRETAA